VNMPPALNFLSGVGDGDELGSVQAAPLIRALRPATFALWFVIISVQVVALVATGERSNLLVTLVSTALFAAVHIQFWWEESEQGRRVARSVERMRGRIYEDDATGLPNSRHFVFELRRQMMRSVRNGRGFSLVLADLTGLSGDEGSRVLPIVGKALRQTLAECDFVAHLEGSVFGAVVVDDTERTAAEKADEALTAISGALASNPAGRAIHPIVSLTGYQGEIEVRDFLRRAHRDLVGARGRELPATSAVRTPPSSVSAA